MNAPLDNLPIQPIEIDTHVHFNGANGPLTNTTNSSSFSSSTDDSNYGFVKSPRLTPRNPVTGMGVQDSFHRGRRMDGRRGIISFTNRKLTFFSLLLVLDIFFLSFLSSSESFLFAFSVLVQILAFLLVD